MLNFAALRAPAGNGETLVEPPAPALADLVSRNRRLISLYAFDVLDLPAAGLRRATRETLGLPAEGVVIGTGHQPEPIHAGVWAKHVVTQRLAEALGGTALNLVVDNDAPKSDGIDIPGRRGDEVAVEHIAIPGLRPGHAYEHRPALSAEQVTRLRSRVAEVMQEAFAASRMPVYLDAWSDAAGERDLVGQLIAARRAAEAPFVHALVDQRVSRAWPNPLAAQTLVDASRFATEYNRALAAYRRANGVRGANRPMPDLAQRGDVVEVPLWIYGPGEPRRRLFVRARGGRIELLADAEPIARLDATKLQRSDSAEAELASIAPRVIRPRALMLTLWARLFLADVFVHGIGGAKYDRITDRLITGYFGVEPPAMACVSATLRLPLPRPRVGIEDLRAARRRRRDLRYNPQRYLSPSPEVATKVERRAAAVARSQTLRRTDRMNRRGRAKVFREIRALNEALVALDPSLAVTFTRDIERTESALAASGAALSREYFFGLFSDAALQGLCDALPSVSELSTRPESSG